MTTAISRTPDFVKSTGTLPPHAPPATPPIAGSVAIEFDLPETGDEPGPAFRNAAECAKWLQQVPLANVSLAQPMLLRQLELLLLLHHAPDHEDHAAIIEYLVKLRRRP